MEDGRTPLHMAAQNGQPAVTKRATGRHKASPCCALSRRPSGRLWLHALVQASPAQTKKQREDADRAMKELLEEEDKDAAAAAAVSQK